MPAPRSRARSRGARCAAARRRPARWPPGARLRPPDTGEDRPAARHQDEHRVPNGARDPAPRHSEAVAHQRSGRGQHRRHHAAVGHRPARAHLAGRVVGPAPGRRVRRHRGCRDALGRPQRPRRPDRQHRPGTGKRAHLRGVRRGPVPGGAVRGAQHPGDPGTRGDRQRQALLRQQPGSRPVQHQRRHRRADDARDLPAGVRGVGQGGQGRLGHVRVPEDQRHVQLREPPRPDDHPQAGVGLRRVRLLRLRRRAQNGQITMATIDDKLVRRYTKMIEFGLFDRTPTITPIPAAEHGRVARKLGAEGIVLLKNANVGAAPVLPLSRASLRSIALIGNDTAKTGGGGSSHVKPLYTVKPSAGLRSRAGSGVTVTVTSGADPTAAAAAARAATVAIVMVEDSESEGHDRTSLALSGNQDALVSAVVAANPRTVVVSKTGGPILMPWVSRVPAILQAWYPGEEDGNAVADVLFGAFNPSGKLPITFPRRETDVPANTTAQYPGIDGTAHYSEGIFVGYRHYDARNIAPLFPFGHGLSYSTYAYSNLKITQGTGANVTVEADVTNTGSRTGAEIVQLYVGSPATAAAPEAPKELQGFQKILLTSGQTGHVSFTLDARSFSFWSTATHRWRIAGGQYRIQLGSSSRDLRLTGTVSLSAA